jgi:hypothetical protein
MAAFAVNTLVGAGNVRGVVGGLVTIDVHLRHLEETEPAKVDSDVDDGLGHAEDEDYGIRNQLTHIVDVKPSRFRLTLLKAVLFAVEIRAPKKSWDQFKGGFFVGACGSAGFAFICLSSIPTFTIN